MKNDFLRENNRFFFIGAGGTSMSALAKYLISEGKKVVGSDVNPSVYTDELISLGAEISFNGDPTDVDGCEVVVYTDAIRENDARLLRAKQLKKIVISRGKFLGELCGAFKKVTAVAGCHGKTTTTAMLAHIYAAAGKKFAVHTGGRDAYFGNFFVSGNDRLITEACEYKKNFLYIKPDTAVILNTEPDHLECYGSAEKLLEAYRDFASPASAAIAKYGCEIGGITFGYDVRAEYSARNVICDKGTYSFTAFHNENELGRIALGIYGEHNVLNAIAAVAAAHTDGIAFEAIKSGLEGFCGVERRMETIGSVNKAKCIADYAHHPTEIEATLNAIQSVKPNRLFVVFQPHTYSRTKNLFKQFTGVLTGIENLMIYRTFAAREYFDDAGSALTLSQNITNSVYGDDPRDIENFISEAAEGDVIVFLGAGDIYDIAKQTVGKFNE